MDKFYETYQEWLCSYEVLQMEPSREMAWNYQMERIRHLQFLLARKEPILEIMEILDGTKTK